MSYVWEKEYLNKKIKELKAYINAMKTKNMKELVFLAEELLELYEFQLLVIKYLQKNR
ncbi:MAG: hypothetical protein QW734_06465 [Candidatus Bathyarchaeia archaeon]